MSPGSDVRLARGPRGLGLGGVAEDVSWVGQLGARGGAGLWAFRPAGVSCGV